MLPIEQLQNLIQGKKVAFIGAGVSHKRCIEQFVELGAQVTLCDQKKSLEDFGAYAVRNWALLQSDYECLYMVADLHSLTVRQVPAELRRRTRELILVLLLALAYGALQGLLGHGPFRFLNTMYLKSLPGNAEIYRPENVAPVENSPLSGMNLCFLGSSVTLGATSLETSFAEYIAVRNNCTYVKEAVSGTTLADNDKNSYIQRMLHNIDPNAQFDAFICQLSTNDASSAIPLGEISSSRNLEDFDTKTVLGALEYIIVYADTTWHCPVVFYTGTQYDSPAYGKMVEQLLKLQEKYEIGVIDLWNDAEMKQVSEEDYKLYMFDGIHPTQAGYLNWWTPKMEAYLYDYLGQ